MTSGGTFQLKQIYDSKIFYYSWLRGGAVMWLILLNILTLISIEQKYFSLVTVCYKTSSVVF